MPVKTQKKTPSRAIKKPLAPEVAIPENPPTDLVYLAGTIPAEILQELASAIQCGKWLCSVWKIKDGQIEFGWMASDFPAVDLPAAVKLLSKDLRKLKK